MSTIRARKRKQPRDVNDFRALASAVAFSYIDIAKGLGLSAETLRAASLRGAAKGFRAYYKKRHKSIKLQPYLAWWMRREVHRVIVRSAFGLARREPKQAERIVLDLLED